MKVICKYNKISVLDKELHQYSFDQDKNGDIDITPGQSYKVYGVKENSFGIFYLVLTDELNSDIPWWMPAGLYEIDSSNHEHPKEWIKNEKKYDFDGKSLTVYSYPIYFEAEEDIEDSTEKGYEVFAKMQEYSSNGH